MNTKTLRIALPAIAILTVVTIAVVAVAVFTHTPVFGVTYSWMP